MATTLRQRLGLGIAKLGAYFGGWNNHYDGAKFYSDRNRSYIDSKIKEADERDGEFTRNTLAGISYKLYSNVGFVRGAVDDKAKYSVGSGIYPYASCDYASSRSKYDAYWEQWGDICEVRQMLNFTEIVKGYSKALDVPGDVGTILTETINGYPQIQIVESHRITNDSEDKDFSDGVKSNALGRPVAYRIKVKADPDDYYVTIPASSLVHTYEMDRFDGRRGVSGLRHAILNIWDKKDILAFEKIGVKFGSSMAATIKIASPADMSAPFFGGQKTQESANGNITMEDILGGAVVKLKPGESLDSFKTDRPSPAFTGFLDYIDRDVAVGLGLPVEFIWDSRALGGTPQRFVLQKAQRTFEERQMTLAKTIKRIRNYVIAKGIKRGDLPMENDWWRVDMQWPSKITVDVGREAEANRRDIAAGIRTEQEDVMERGRRFGPHRKQIQEAVQDLISRAKELHNQNPEVPLEACLQLMQQRSTGGGQIQFNNQPSGGQDGGNL